MTEKPLADRTYTSLLNSITYELAVADSYLKSQNGGELGVGRALAPVLPLIGELHRRSTLEAIGPSSAGDTPPAEADYPQLRALLRNRYSYQSGVGYPVSLKTTGFVDELAKELSELKFSYKIDVASTGRKTLLFDLNWERLSQLLEKLGV